MSGPATFTLRYRDEVGRLHRTEAIARESAPHAGRLPARLLVDQDGRVLLQKWAPVTSGRDGTQLLDAEIRALTRLKQVYPDCFPPELPRLVGYGAADEPYVLLEPLRGLPARSFAGRLTLPEQHSFRAGLFRALEHCAAADLIHGGIGSAAVRWDGRTIQLVDFSHAVRVGPTTPSDMPNAAALVLEMLVNTSGRPTRVPALDALLGDALYDGRQPTTTAVARRLETGPEVVRGPDPEERLADDRRAFETDLAARQHTGTPQRRGRRRDRRRASRSFGTAHRLVRCPVCLDLFVWAGVDRSRPEVGDSDDAEIPCPNPHADTDAHLLPADYGRYPDPIIVAVVGAAGAGKSTLIRALLSSLTDAPQRRADSTAALGLTSTVELKSADGRRRPLTLVEVAAGQPPQGPTARALLYANALMFVCQPPLDASGNAATVHPTFAPLLDDLRADPAGFGRPAAVVLTKTDQLRYVPPMERWFSNAPTLIDESRDVFAYLRHHGAHDALSIYAAFPRCSLHATWIPEGHHPHRVLGPLGALLDQLNQPDPNGAVNVKPRG